MCCGLMRPAYLSVDSVSVDLVCEGAPEVIPSILSTLASLLGTLKY